MRSASQGMSLENLADRVDGDRLESPARPGRRGRLEQGVVNRLLSRLECRLEQRRNRISWEGCGAGGPESRWIASATR